MSRTGGDHGAAMRPPGWIPYRRRRSAFSAVPWDARNSTARPSAAGYRPRPAAEATPPLRRPLSRVEAGGPPVHRIGHVGVHLSGCAPSCVPAEPRSPRRRDVCRHAPVRSPARRAGTPVVLPSAGRGSPATARHRTLRRGGPVRRHAGRTRTFRRIAPTPSADLRGTAVGRCRQGRELVRDARAPLRAARHFACRTVKPIQTSAVEAISGDVADQRIVPSKVASRPLSGPSPKACTPGPRTRRARTTTICSKAREPRRVRSWSGTLTSWQSPLTFTGGSTEPRKSPPPNESDGSPAQPAQLARDHWEPHQEPVGRVR